MIDPVVVAWPCVFTVGRWTMFLPGYIAGISIPSGKISFSLKSGDLNRCTRHSTSGSATKPSPNASRTGSQRLFLAPVHGSVTTVLFSAGINRVGA